MSAAAHPALDRRDVVRRRCEFESLYHRHKEVVWRYCYLHCNRDAHIAEDVVQEVFSKAWRALERGESTWAPKAWLLNISRNACIDQQRRAGRALPTVALSAAFEIADGSWEADSNGRVAFRETVAALRDVVMEIPHEELEAWFLCDVLGLSSREAAVALDVEAATTVRSRNKRARDKIAAVGFI